MGQAVAERTILRKKEDGSWENWGDVAHRVALGNALLSPTCDQETLDPYAQSEYVTLRKHIANGDLLMSGRHLQHGDELQPTRNLELFSNCSTAAASFALFYLLMNGSGVGRCYDDDMMLVDWDNAPNLRCVLSSDHPDFDYIAHESVRDAKHKYTGKDILWHTVADSREGWAKALEIWENAAFEKIHASKMLVLDFSEVRAKGSPIRGMQSRPASGPVPLMNAFLKSAALKGSKIAPWKQAMYVDHYFAECVLVGGARRAARIATKHWKDPSIFDFIEIKRPIEFTGKRWEDVVEMRENANYNSFLWSANNSVMVDGEFWQLNNLRRSDQNFDSDDAKYARKVFKYLTQASYADGTGEPGIINAHKLSRKDEGWDDLKRGDYFGSSKYQIEDDSQVYLGRLAKRAKRKKYNMIVNPCGEITINLLGGFCIIADLAPYFCESLGDVEESARAAVRALMRVNLMDTVYRKEVDRTWRIGVGLTGVHEFAFKFFGYGFKDLIDENKSLDFWEFLASINEAIRDEAKVYAEQLGVTVPHTVTTIKPAGTTSKLFGLTEGWHLPSMAYYMRWVQFRSDDPLVAEYAAQGYRVRDLTTYTGTSIVGFPTAPLISTLGLGDKLVCAGDATPEEQYKWLQLGERYWIDGTNNNDQMGNQISYTLKYKPDKVDYYKFKDTLRTWQQRIKCCSVMPQIEVTSYEYQPEEPVTKAEYEQVCMDIRKNLTEDIDAETMKCDGGACPVDVRSDEEMQEIQ